MKETVAVRRYIKTKENKDRQSGTLMLITCESERKHTHTRVTHVEARALELPPYCVSLHPHDDQVTL